MKRIGCLGFVFLLLEQLLFCHFSLELQSEILLDQRKEIHCKKTGFLFGDEKNQFGFNANKLECSNFAVNNKDLFINSASYDEISLNYKHYLSNKSFIKQFGFSLCSERLEIYNMTFLMKKIGLTSHFFGGGCSVELPEYWELSAAVKYGKVRLSDFFEEENGKGNGFAYSFSLKKTIWWNENTCTLLLGFTKGNISAGGRLNKIESIFLREYYDFSGSLEMYLLLLGASYGRNFGLFNVNISPVFCYVPEIKGAFKYKKVNSIMGKSKEENKVLNIKADNNFLLLPKLDFSVNISFPV